MSTKTDDLFEKVTANLIDLIENSTEKWNKPWTTMVVGTGLPTNFITKKAYQGFNTWALWLTAQAEGYEHHLWATYKQWQTVGGQVRKGEHGTVGVRWGVTYHCSTCRSKSQSYDGHEGHNVEKSVWATPFTVFNIAQVDGVELPEVIKPENTVERLAQVDAFIQASGANIQHRAGDRAYYTPGTNDIVLPLVEQFESQAGYYATILHELTHWSGDASRLGRDQRNVFGSERYAAEELVAEMGSALLQAHFGIEASEHIQAAAYIKGWLRVLKADAKNLYKAAKQAQEAATYLLGLQATETTTDAADELVAA